MSNNQNESIPFNRDKFVRNLFVELRKQALEYKTRKDGTSSENLFIGAKPLMYDFFVDE
jgi:hypothetical protein